jgi:hypothetical protein
MLRAITGKQTRCAFVPRINATNQPCLRNANFVVGIDARALRLGDPQHGRTPFDQVLFAAQVIAAHAHFRCNYWHPFAGARPARQIPLPGTAVVRTSITVKPFE